MGLDERITYWRARATVARKHLCGAEAGACERIAEKLVELREFERKAEAYVKREFIQMPEELFEGGK